jgi:hypothetical protein
VSDYLRSIFDIEKYKQAGSLYDCNSTLILNDWTSKTDNGWAFTFPFRIIQNTSKLRK